MLIEMRTIITFPEKGVLSSRIYDSGGEDAATRNSGHMIGYFFTLNWGPLNKSSTCGATKASKTDGS